MKKAVFLLIASSILSVSADVDHKIDQGFINSKDKHDELHDGKHDDKKPSRIVRKGLDDVKADAHPKYQKIRLDETTGDWRTYIFQEKDGGDIVDDLILTT